MANLSFLSAKHFQPWTALWRIWTYHFNPVFFSLIDTSKMIFFWLTPWTQKGAGVFTFRCIHLSPISKCLRPVDLFYRNFRTPCRWCHRPIVDSLIRRPNNRRSHFVCPTSSGNPLLCRSGWAGLHGIRKKVPKTHGLHRWKELQVTGPFFWKNGLVLRILFDGQCHSEGN